MPLMTISKKEFRQRAMVIMRDLTIVEIHHMTRNNLMVELANGNLIQIIRDHGDTVRTFNKKEDNGWVIHSWPEFHPESDDDDDEPSYGPMHVPAVHDMSEVEKDVAVKVAKYKERKAEEERKIAESAMNTEAFMSTVRGSRSLNMPQIFDRLGTEVRNNRILAAHAENLKKVISTLRDQKDMASTIEELERRAK